MKQHLDDIARANKAIDDGEAKLARIRDERTKLEAAHTAATRSATDLRTQASHALALVAVGDGSDDAQKLVQQAEAAEKRAAGHASTLAGLDDLAAAAEESIEKARGSRMGGTRAALEAHAVTVVDEYRKAANAYIKAIRRVHAIDMIRASMGDARRLLRSRECSVPGIVGDDTRLVGEYNDMLYSARHDLYQPHLGPQADATEAEIALLAKAGLEV